MDFHFGFCATLMLCRLERDRKNRPNRNTHYRATLLLAIGTLYFVKWYSNKNQPMDLFFVIGNIAFGLIMTLIGFKIYNPFKGKNEPEKEALWFKKYGTFFKIAGLIILIGGIIRLL